MTREELDFIGSMNLCDEISNEAYKKIVCHCREQEPCDELDFVQPHKKLSVNLEVCKMREVTKEEREGIDQYIDSIAEPCEDAISRQAVEDKLLKLCNELEGIFADIRMKEGNDCVCGLCEYDYDHGIDGSAFECPGFETDECFKLADEIRHEWQCTKDLSPVTPQPKTGHWVDIDEEPHEVWECDHCGFVIDGSGCIDPYDYRDTYKFCPNCGCRMVEPQESEDR